jgi:uroporphyrinogen III methyltransferase/synthase
MSKNQSGDVLKGRTFLITRTVQGNKVEREKLEKLGANVIELPLIEIGPPSNPRMIKRSVQEIDRFDWIIFTSANGVNSFFSYYRDNEDRGKRIRAKFACVGLETQRALEEKGFAPTFVPSEFLTQKLAQELVSKFPMQGKRVLLPRAEEASQEIATILEKAGALVVEAPVYRTIIRRIENLDKKDILNQVTDITLTSPSTVKGLVTNFSAEEIKLRNIRLHCIGPVTASVLKEEHIVPFTVSNIHTIDGLIDSILG